MPVTVTPLEGKPLGATITLPEGCTDPSTLSEEDFQTLYNALHEHLVVVIPGMADLSPESQWKLTARFDPTCNQKSKSYGHGKEFRHDQSVLKRDGTSIPGQPQVQVLGQGKWEAGHWGLGEVALRHPVHFDFHKTPLSDEDAYEKDLTRFYRWHIDSALYDLAPPVCTTLLGIHVPPHSRTQTVDYGDGRKLEVTQGATAFVSGAKAFEMLSPEDQKKAMGTKVVYAPHPYIFISPARATSDGLTMVSEGKEMPLDQLPPWEKSKIKELPLVWTNPVTKKPHLQVHGCCIYQLKYPDGTVLELEDARKAVHEMMKPAIAPENVYAHSWNSGDLALFFNRGVWHSVTGQFKPGERRLMHQCNIASGQDPVTLNFVAEEDVPVASVETESVNKEGITA
ncbi:(ZYRO0D16324g) [Zygosaccharomyces parabailii]|nr:(ZYRO0D16324g) [Zygosaccharomyces parabailii]CDH09086.1 related to Putative dioxygenase C576.01c [Zygosaccharomyces bailii ISA1307]